MLGPYHKLRNFLERKYYTWRARRICARVGVGLRVNHRSAFTPKTEIGDYCNFNGMIIGGNGRVVIGSHFHSGTGCQMITSNHNYDHGTQIPYDSTYIDKDIIIGDQVWLGNNVVLLGGGQKSARVPSSKRAASSLARYRPAPSLAATRRRCSRCAMKSTTTSSSA